MSALKELVTYSAESGLAVSRKLLQYSQRDGSKSFAKRAIKYLVKKLKDKLDELEALLLAVTSYGNCSSKCVTLQRSSDGRLQISGCTNFPHLIYARIWRWPDLRNHWGELQHVKNCRYGFDLNCKFVCVNPYHYERITALPSTNFPKLLKTPNENMLQHYGYKTFNEIEKRKATGNKASFITNSSQLFAYDRKYDTAENCEKTTYINTEKKPKEKCIIDYWCSVSYFEYNTQLESTFKVPKGSSTIQITGYVEIFGNYHLGLGKIVSCNRIIKSERVLMNIGRGIQMELRKDGTVWLRLLSKYQIFVQSLYINFLVNRPHDDNMPYKIYPSAVLKIFDIRDYYKYIKQFYNDGDKLSYYSNEFCTLKISFGKGWGPGYSRKSVEETPCWINIFLNKDIVENFSQ